jgi:MFS family permease
VENAPPGWRGRFGMFPQLGAPIGFIAANGLFLLIGMVLTQEQFIEWGWRIPFLLSAVLVAVGLWVRLKLTETLSFQRALEEAPPPRVPFATLFRHHWRETLAGTFAVVACFAVFYIATAFALGYGTTTLGYDRTSFLQIQLGAILFMALGIVLAGWLSDIKTPRWVLILGCIGAVPGGLLLGPMMGSGSGLMVFLFLSLMLLLMGFLYGPLGAFLPGLFPANVRYTGASVAFNVGGILGGALAPMIAQTLADAGGLFLVGVYLSVAALVSVVALALSPKKQLT